MELICGPVKLKMIRISVTLTKDQSISLPAGLEVVCPVKEEGSVFAEIPVCQMARVLVA